MLSNVENSQVERELRLIWLHKVTRNGCDCAQCLHCSVVMSNASIRPSTVKNHRDKKHRQRKNDDIDSLCSKRVRYDLEATLPYLGFKAKEKPTLQSS